LISSSSTEDPVKVFSEVLEGWRAAITVGTNDGPLTRLSIDSLIGKRDLERSREVLVTWQLRQRSEHAYVSMACILTYSNI